jgi:hypothetical protein
MARTRAAAGAGPTLLPALSEINKKFEIIASLRGNFEISWLRIRR